jgi:biopolymer transport protein ExbD
MKKVALILGLAGILSSGLVYSNPVSLPKKHKTEKQNRDGSKKEVKMDRKGNKTTTKRDANGNKVKKEKKVNNY